MSLLAIESVSKRYREGRREHTVLRDVSLEVRPAELIVVWGMRRSGRSTLLRIAAGVESPDAGNVRFEGRDLSGEGKRSLGRGIGYVHTNLRGSEEQGVLEHVGAALMARGVATRAARERGRDALIRVGAEHCTSLRVGELGAGERVQVALAATLALSPRLVVLDEPAGAVELSERDGILTLMRTLTAEGVAVLASTAEADELAGAHRALTLSDGELRGPARPELAPVVALRARGV
jgi:putative ABC transport system ATP-binding protein